MPKTLIEEFLQFISEKDEFIGANVCMEYEKASTEDRLKSRS